MARREKARWSDDLKVGIIGAAAVVAVGVFQVLDGPDPLACYEVRTAVLEQAEKDPDALTPYPDDSREERECQINTYISDLD